MNILNQPVHRSLTKTLVWGGMPRNFFLSYIALIFFSLWLFPVYVTILWAGVVGYVARHFTEQDPQFFKIFLNSLKNKNIFYTE